MLKATPSNSRTAPGAHPGANVDWTLHDRYKAAVERLEALALEIARQLDELAGDPDLEDGGDDEPGTDDEPSLGSLGSGAPRHTQERWAGHKDDKGRDSDLEEQCEDEGGACEDEGAQCDDEGAVEGL